jgi:hypothetical protein
VQVVTPGDSDAQTCATLAISDLSVPFCATTAAFIPPAAFSFAVLADAPFNQNMESTPFTLSTSTLEPITVSGGMFSVNGQPYTSASGTVKNGDRITVMLMTLGTSATETCMTLTIGGVPGQFCATTVTYRPPDPGLIVPLLLDDE